MSTTSRDHGLPSFDPVRLFDLERISPTRFVGHGPGNAPSSHLYGGQIVAQALAAAQRSVGERHCHSLHAYFLAAGSPRRPLTFDVEILRDGGRFSIRRVRVGQDDRHLCDITASFHSGDASGANVEHQLVTMPHSSTPEELVELSALPIHDEGCGLSGELVLARNFEQIDVRLIEPDALRHQVPSGRRLMWTRLRGVPQDANITLGQQCLTYLSDYLVAGTGKLPHPAEYRLPLFGATSLDHAVWFHKPWRASDWVLFEQYTTFAAEGRAMVRGNMWSRDGEFLASVVQEVLFRSLR
ncbi:acyl-CoA thioesterase [Novosphingobium cyanobacteriorum]|uniref:Thioesterase family protein n=1 Tax=Novosphingobium cyanobacteriorum TaxID=3024215 RepID=A0ABT6CPG0_9SPHN|nr:acyl-CoA thioesterase domain-containing protein [Novosphingobium cyanobacteriorum]MDF8335374.1 thioesterase family protein [Novosphingobium cyanobacteriorum]